MAKKVKRTYEIPLAVAERIIRKAGAERVSEEAKRIFRDSIEEIAEEVAKKAVDLAKHAKRKTVKPEDVKLAVKE
ncbi:MAG TPA: histone family protein [Nautiliaceae bacterium]|nr:histone family protein [Nautiliaceae bacterium]